MYRHPLMQTRFLTTTTPTISVLLLVLLLLTVSVDALFVQPPYKVKPFALQLAIADSLGIAYRGFAYDAGKAASLPNFALSLNTDFGALDESSFNAFQTAYCAWSETKSRVTWKEGRTYTLLDFLPPVMQAVSGLHFRSSRTPQLSLPFFVGDRVQECSEQEVLLTSNCWGFAWEVLFQADNADTRALTISTADPTSAWRAFTGPGFDLIQSSRSQPKLMTDSDVRNKNIQGGDVLLIWHENPSTVSGQDLYLDHVATVIDSDVYFEKSGSGDKVPFRVVTWEGLTANFPPSVFFWEWRRLVRNNPLSLKVSGSPHTRVRPATELFSVDAQLRQTFLRERFSLLSQLAPGVSGRISLQADSGDDGIVESQTYTGILVLEDLVFDKETGRASLPKSAFLPEWYVQVLQRVSENPKT